MDQDNAPGTHISHPAISPWISCILEIKTGKGANLRIQITGQTSPDIYVPFATQLTQIST